MLRALAQRTHKPIGLRQQFGLLRSLIPRTYGHEVIQLVVAAMGCRLLRSPGPISPAT